MEMGITAIVSNADPAIPGDNITKPLISALLPLLASRYEGASRDKNVLDGDSTSPEPAGTTDDSTAGSSPGSILDGLGGLIEQFRRIGLGDTVDTWFKPGPNKRVAPNDIALVLGEDAIDELARRTGLSRGRVLVELSKLLPRVVDQLTPEGQLPTLQEIVRFMSREAQR
jgi:uncharacterized protein YidB (DUF937 family)